MTKKKISKRLFFYKKNEIADKVKLQGSSIDEKSSVDVTSISCETYECKEKKNISDANKATHECVDAISEWNSSKEEVNASGEVADSVDGDVMLDQDLDEDKYSRLLNHTSSCKVKTVQYQYRTQVYLKKLHKYNKENGNIPTAYQQHYYGKGITD